MIKVNLIAIKDTKLIENAGIDINIWNKYLSLNKRGDLVVFFEKEKPFIRHDSKEEFINLNYIQMISSVKFVFLSSKPLNIK
jgi:hypothetical protein